MQFNKVLFSTILLFILCCLPGTLTVRLHHKGRSASKRLIPLQTRSKYLAHGRSSAADALFDELPPVEQAGNSDESRGFMKKLMLFKSLFYQQKSEPTNNIIIITQPTATVTPTVTTPTATGTAGTTTTTAAALPDDNGDDNIANIGLNTILARDSIKEAPLLNYQTIKELQDSQAEDIVKQIIKQNKTNNRRRLNKVKKFNRNNLQQHNQRKRRLRKRNQMRKRMPTHQNTINVENLLNNMNLTKRTNQHAKSTNSNNHHNDKEDNEDNNNDEIDDIISVANEHNQKHNDNDVNNASGILNLNTNMRLQNIMNAFRKQTPIMYNY